MARRKCSIKISVFCTSLLYTVLAATGQNGTAGPNSLLIAVVSAVLPVPGGPTNSTDRPASFLAATKSTITPHAWRAWTCPTKPHADSDDELAAAEACAAAPSVAAPSVVAVLVSIASFLSTVAWTFQVSTVLCQCLPRRVSPSPRMCVWALIRSDAEVVLLVLVLLALAVVMDMILLVLLPDSIVVCFYLLWMCC
jgi:hypothetical protein